jgi:phage tail-like protein
MTNIVTDAEDPLVSFMFSLEVQGTITGFFTEVSGIGSENEVSEHLVVGQNGQQVVKKVAGRLKWEDITLKRGITSAMDAWAWRKQIEDGNLTDARKNGSIVMYNQVGEEVARWNFENAWPVKITGPAPSSESSDLGIEEMVLAHEYIVRVA